MDIGIPLIILGAIMIVVAIFHDTMRRAERRQRDHFAATALHGVMVMDNLFEDFLRGPEESVSQDVEEHIASLSYRIADAMMRERSHAK